MGLVRFANATCKRGIAPSKRLLATKLDVIGSDWTLLIGNMSLKNKYGFLGNIMERLIMKPQLVGAVDDLFAGVEEYYKTGKIQKVKATRSRHQQ